MSEAQLSIAHRMKGMSGNVIREILKLTQQPDIISFAGGLPSPDSFPVAELRRITDNGFGGALEGLLQYSTSEGYPPLRAFLADWVADRGIHTDPEEICILTGSQQGIDLACKALLNPGDTVLVERPTYLAALQIFKLYEVNVVAVSGDSQGMDPEVLQKAVKAHRPRMIYLVPTFRNPSGETWSQERRRHVTEVAAEAGATILEDDPYGVLRYSGDPVPAVKAFDPGDTVIYLGSFSKIVSPGLRVGYAVANPEILRRMVIGKQATDVHTSNVSQFLVNAFCRSEAFSSHLHKVCANYRDKRDRMFAAMAAHFPSKAVWTRPEGGLFVWVTLPEGLRTGEILEKAVQEKVAFIPGSPFFADGSGENTMRLNFSNAGFDKIDQGIARLGRVLSQALTAAAPSSKGP